MIYLDSLWGEPRTVQVSGRTHRVPFAVRLPLDLSKFIMDWFKTNGQEWTAGRLKLLVLWAIQIIAGNHEYTIPWFTKTRFQGYLIPKLRIFKYLIKNLRNPNRVRLVLAVLKSYRLKTWGKPSLDSVANVKRTSVPDSYIRLLRQYCTLPRVPLSVLEPVDAVNTRKSYAIDSGRTLPGPYGRKDFDFPAEISMLYEDEFNDPFILGTLTTVKDKGKFRTILVGHWALQLRTKKLADWLRRWLWDQKEVASGDQTKMRDYILTNMESGKFMMSIDLSNATDRLSREFQIKLLTSMGVPKGFFRFLELPAAYRLEEFEPEKGKGIQKVSYSNGQPMGLFISFPMFELMHYVILKSVVAITDATFCICGDDCVIACNEKDSENLFKRYRILIERFGGVISVQKTVLSKNVAEGIGALFMKGYPKEIRIPSGKISILEAMSPGFKLNDMIRSECPLGRAIAYSWLNTKERKDYTHNNRRALNEFVLTTDLSDLHISSLRSLSSHQTFPISWYVWEDPPTGVSGMVPRFREGEEIPEEVALTHENVQSNHFRYVSLRKYRDAKVTSKIISLYKKSTKGNNLEK